MKISKRMPKLLAVLAFVLVSCAPKNTIIVTQTSRPFLSPTSVPVRDLLTNTPTALPTITPYPTLENQPRTLPTIQPAKCPPANPSHQVIFPTPPELLNEGDFGKIAMQALSEGASISQVAEAFDRSLGMSGSLPVKDLTGDSVPELIINQLINTIVISCDNGQYRTILDYNSANDGGHHSPWIFDVQDMNLNGIPDVVLTYEATTGWNTTVDILEWNENQFISLIQANHGENSPSTSKLAKSLYWYSNDWLSLYGYTNIPHMNGPAEIVIRDTDNNGTKELILTDKGPSHWDTVYSFGPWRGQQVIFKWDGIHYLYSSLEMNPPVYRFQAVQDADRFFLIGEYEKALRLYNDVVSNKDLEWWSLERIYFIRDSFFAQLNKDITPTPPQSNENEYSLLAAYAKYRTILAYLYLDRVNDALTEYNSLIENFPNGTPGSPFVDMATILWNK